MKCDKIHALKIFKIQQIRPKASILTSPQLSPCAMVHLPTMPLAWQEGEGALTISILRFLSFLRTLSVTLNNMISNILLFKYQPVGSNLETFRGFLQYLLNQIKGISQFAEKHVFYAAEDIPVFHLFAFKKLSDFKFFYWRKTILNHPELQNLKFKGDCHDEGLLDLAEKSSLTYSEIESTEVWTEETIASTLKQIKFYHEAGLFEKREDAFEIIEDLRNLILKLQKQCDLGLKIRPGGSVSSTPFVVM